MMADQPKTVQFEHAFFKRMSDIFFRLDERTGEAVAVVTLGEERLILPFGGLRREFKLDDGPDGQMLTLMAKGLKYVKGLRIGDPLPPEITTRRASWKPEPRHHQIAYHRLSMQVLGWLSGDEHIITNPEELLQVTGDPNFKRKVNEAFSEAAEHLGLGRENREKVIEYITALADELSYIEAMRDQFHLLQEMEAKIQLLRRLYGAHRSVLEIADPVARLIERAVAEFAEQFEQADAQTGEIMAALKNIDAQKIYIQDRRDEIHVRLMPWDELLDEWHRLPPKRGEWSEDLLARTYRFLAPRYMPVDEWAMMTKVSGAQVSIGADGKVVKPKKTKRLGGMMEWG
ncbi:hypothetical protein ACM64Y_07900 [Novispirillum sp. DQ9]|uniref:hypothetical protein n=1 Tax=Novispirillum sp. DQ9 TaxID=3398612 RepID=UPI003C7B3D66